MFTPLTINSYTVPGTAHRLDGFRGWVYSEQFLESGQITYCEGQVFVDKSVIAKRLSFLPGDKISMIARMFETRPEGPTIL